MPSDVEEQKPWEMFSQSKPWELFSTQEEKPELSLPEGIREGVPGEKSIYEEPTWMDKPVLNLGQVLLKQPSEAKSETEKGVLEALTPAVDALTTPRNLAYMLGTLGIGATGTAGKILASTLWTGAMGKQAIEDAPQLYGQLGEEMAKPEGERDKKKIASLLTQGGLNAALAIAPAVHTVGELGLGDRPLTSEVTDPSKVGETTAVHESLRPQPEPGVREVPTEESSKGVQLQTKESEVPLTTEQVLQPEKQIPLGAATAEEFPVDPGNPDIYGVRQASREARSKAGQVEPVQPGEGIAAQDSVERGQEILKQDPMAGQKAVTAFESDPKKSVSAEGMAVARAEGERLAKVARDFEEKYGTDSAEYQKSYEDLSEWDRRTNPMQTEWHKIGQAQQGETDIDTGSFTGLRRAYQKDTGKDLPEESVPRAKKVASGVKDAKDATEAAQKNFQDYVKSKPSSIADAVKRAQDAANKTVREAAILRANAENKARVAKSAREKKFAEQDRKAAQKKLDAANKAVREAAIQASRAENKERVAKADLPNYVWGKAREYIEKGETNFDDIRHKIATDIGRPVKEVSAALGKDRKAKFLTDDLWKKQQTLRRLDEQAKRWLLSEQMPGYRRWLENVPRALFTSKVMGHGTVALGTHAPMVAFQPPFWGSYLKNFVKMYKMVGSPTFYENQVQDLLRRPNYTIARRAGLVNDPFQYEDYNSPDVMKSLGNLTAMGNRGYSVLKMLRQDMFDHHWNKLPKTSRIKEVAEAISDSVNHATGVVKVSAPKGAAVAFFAPRLELSRAAWLARDPIKMADTFIRAGIDRSWKGIDDGDEWFAIHQLKEKATVFATGASILALNQAFLNLTGSDQKINGVPEFMGGKGFDPMKSDFLKFKVAGMTGSYGNAMTAMARLPARLFVGVANEGKLNKIIYADENVATILFDFARSQMSPFMGTVTDLGIGRDFQRRPLPRAAFGLLEGSTNIPKRLKSQGVEPYTWTEYLTTQFLPIPAEEAVRELWKHDFGMGEEEISSYLKALAIFSVMMGTGGRLTEDYDVQ